MRFEHRARRIAQREVHVGDDAGRDARVPVQTARGHRGYALGELRLPDGAQRLGTVRAVHRHAVHVDRARDPVAAADVCEQLVEQVAIHAAAHAIPEMVVRVADPQLGLEHRLGELRQPVGAIDAHGSYQIGELQARSCTTGE